MTRAITALMIGAAITLTGVSASAQNYPSGNVTLIVPFSPGGGTDLASRLVADALGAQQGWTVIVDNRPGAGGNIGIAQVARSAPDGLTIGMGQTSNLAINPTLYHDIPYDPETDFAPIAIINSQPSVIAVPANSPYETLADLIAAAEQEPGNIAMGTPGSGTVAHLTLELLGVTADVEFLHVPYPGASQAVTDAIGGHVDFVASSLPSALSHIRSGTLRALAVTSPERNDAVPDVPTVAESGYDDFSAGDWKAVVGPAGLPEDIVATLNAAINEALQDDTLRTTFAADGSTIVGGSPEELRELIAAERGRWADIIELSGATTE